MFCDFGKPSGVLGFFEGVFDRHGTPDLIINNASAFEYDFPGRGSAEILDKSLAIHVRTPALLLEFANRKASSRRPITVVNILDQKVVNLNPDYYSYTVGKSALFAITRMWQMAPSSKLRVFGILPGLLFPSGKQTQHDFERVRNDTLLNRNATPQEIANAILFVARTPSMPGQNLTIDGGRVWFEERATLRTNSRAFETAAEPGMPGRCRRPLNYPNRRPRRKLCASAGSPR